MKNIIKYILVLLACLIVVTIYTGCIQEKPVSEVQYNSMETLVSRRNDKIIESSNKAETITVKYDMDKEIDSFVDESVKDMEQKGYYVINRKVIESTRVMSTNPDVFRTVVEYVIITYKKVR